MHPLGAYVVARLLQDYAQERHAEAEQARLRRQAAHSGIVAGRASRLSDVLRKFVSGFGSNRVEGTRAGHQPAPRLADEHIGA
jgi:hypothetical protein